MPASCGFRDSARTKARRGPIGRDLPFVFKLEHMLKDVRLCLEQGQEVGAPFQSAAWAREILSAGIGRGLGDADFAALIEVLEGAAGTKL